MKHKWMLHLDSGGGGTIPIILLCTCKYSEIPTNPNPLLVLSFSNKGCPTCIYLRAVRMLAEKVPSWSPLAGGTMRCHHEEGATACVPISWASANLIDCPFTDLSGLGGHNQWHNSSYWVVFCIWESWLYNCISVSCHWLPDQNDTLPLRCRALSGWLLACLFMCMVYEPMDVSI